MNNFIIISKKLGKILSLWLYFLITGIIITTLLFNTLFYFFKFSHTITDFNSQLLILFPVLFCYFSIPSLVILSSHKKFSYKKCFLMLLESHTFFFGIQTIFLSMLCYYGLDLVKILIEFASNNTNTNDAMAELLLAPITVRLLPFIGCIFIWIATRASLAILKDEEKKISEDFIFSNENDIYFTPPKIISAFSYLEICNILLLLLVLAIFVPINLSSSIIEFLPKICEDPFLFLSYFILYYLVLLEKKEKRINFVFAHIVFSSIFYFYLLNIENTAWQLIFSLHYVAQLFANIQLIRFQKQYFI